MENQLCSLCDYDPAKIRELKKSPIIDYYMVLDSRVKANEAIKKANAKAKR